jgi:xylulokinase
MRDCLEVMREMGVTATEIRLSGGGARSPFWRQLQADVYGQRVTTVNATDGAPYGAALLAMVGTGAFETVPQACEAIKVTEEILPNDAHRPSYDRAYATYRKLYSRLKEEFKNWP